MERLELYTLHEAYTSLLIKDYEGAMIDLQDCEGGIFDQLKTAISLKEYTHAKEICKKRIDELQERLENV